MLSASVSTGQLGRHGDGCTPLPGCKNYHVAPESPRRGDMTEKLSPDVYISCFHSVERTVHDRRNPPRLSATFSAGHTCS